MSIDFDDIIIDSAVLTVGGVQFTASRGGWSFEPNETWEDFDFPGKTMNTKGCRELVSLAPTLKGSAMMTGEAQMSAFRPSGQWSDSETIEGVRFFTPAAIRDDLTLADYLTDVFCIWKRIRNDYIAVEFPFAICTSWGIGAADNDEGLIPLTIAAAQSPLSGTTKTRIPYRIHTFPFETETTDL